MSAAWPKRRWPALATLALTSAALLCSQRAAAQEVDRAGREYQPLTPRDSREQADDGLGRSLTAGATSGFRGDCGLPAAVALPGPDIGVAGADSVDMDDEAAGIGGDAEQSWRYLQLSTRVSETYTDNVNRESDDRAQSDLITAVTPRIDLCASTGRARGTLTYAPQLLVYANNSDYNDVYQSVAADGTAELYNRQVFIDFDTRYGQAVIQPALGSPDSNAIRPTNQTSAWILNVSPYAIQDLGNAGTASARYRFGNVEYGDPDVPDSQIQSVVLSLVSLEGQRFGWQAQVLSQRAERSGGDRGDFFDTGLGNDLGNEPGLPEQERDEADLANSALDGNETFYFDQARLDFDYRITRLFTLTVGGGLETSYDDRGDAQRFEEPFYRVGGRVESGASVFAAGIGEHYYGTSFDVSIEHNTPRLRSRVSYEEQADSPGREQFSRGLAGSQPGGAVPQPVDPGGPIDTGRGSLLRRGVFIEKRLEAASTLYGARTTTTLSAYRSQRDYEVAGIGNETYRGASVDIAYALTPRTALEVGFEYRERDDSGGDQQDLIGGAYVSTDAVIALTRELSPSAGASIGYLRSRGSGEDQLFEYTENRLTVALIKNF